jgi:hypothetical protein
MTPTATLERSEIERLLYSQPTVSTSAAFEFLGVGRDLGFRLMTAYRRRIAKTLARGRGLVATDVLPRRDPKTGELLEIANQKIGGKVMCRSDLLLWTTFPERTVRAEP